MQFIRCKRCNKIEIVNDDGVCKECEVELSKLESTKERLLIIKGGKQFEVRERAVARRERRTKLTRLVKSGVPLKLAKDFLARQNKQAEKDRKSKELREKVHKIEM